MLIWKSEFRFALIYISQQCVVQLFLYITVLHYLRDHSEAQWEDQCKSAAGKGAVFYFSLPADK